MMVYIDGIGTITKISSTNDDVISILLKDNNIMIAPLHYDIIVTIIVLSFWHRFCLKLDLGGLMNNLKLFPFMGMADISEGGDANELESGYYINGNFRNLTNSPFDSGWGGIIVFKINYYTLQIASDMNTKIFKVRQRWYNTWDNWRTLSLTWFSPQIRAGGTSAYCK